MTASFLAGASKTDWLSGLSDALCLFQGSVLLLDVIDPSAAGLVLTSKLA